MSLLTKGTVSTTHGTVGIFGCQQFFLGGIGTIRVVPLCNGDTASEVFCQSSAPIDPKDSENIPKELAEVEAAV
jgi:hypothetical protein